VCNLYSITTNQAAIIALFRVMNRYVGNLQPMLGVFPDYPAPVVRNAGTERELVMMRWGMPPPPRAGGYPVTNIRNASSPHWRGWLKPALQLYYAFFSLDIHATAAITTAMIPPTITTGPISAVAITTPPPNAIANEPQIRPPSFQAPLMIAQTPPNKMKAHRAESMFQPQL
jgi:hypothetical protein